MPELPEVETVRRGLAPHLVGARLTRVIARRPDLRFPFPDGFVQRLTGARVESLGRRGKYILAPLDRGDTLTIHLGMSGRIQVLATDVPPAGEPVAHVATKHAHVVFETDRGATLTYFDPRRFGYMDLIETARIEAHPRFSGMGPEPLGPDFTAAWLGAVFADRRQSAKTLLLDQTLVAGLGNIYVCEALHAARISPLGSAGDIPRRQVAALTDAIRKVLEAAIEAGGSTLRDYANVEGGMGYFQHAFQVYGREGEACPRKRCAGVVQRLQQGGRSTFFCPKCQT